MSNLVVKMMSAEDLPDENTSKGFTLVEAYGEVRCVRDALDQPRIEIPLESGQTALYHPEGNTYLLKNGKTVATFAHVKLNAVARSLKELKGAVRRENSKALLYTPDNSTMVVDKDELFISTNNGKLLVIDDSILTKSAVIELTALGYIEVDSFLNVDAKVWFTVFKPPSKLLKKPIPRGAAFEVHSEPTLANLLRLTSSERPRFIMVNSALRGVSVYSDLIPDYTSVVSGYIGHGNMDLFEYHPIVVANEFDDSFDSKGGVTPVLSSRSELMGWINRSRLGDMNPLVQVNLTEGDCGESDVEAITNILSDHGYQQAYGSTYYYARLTDNVAEVRLISSESDMAVQFADGIPHSIIVPLNTDELVDNISDKFGINSPVVRLFNYKLGKTLRTRDGGLAKELLRHVGDVSEDFSKPEPGQISKVEDITFLEQVPIKFRPNKLYVAASLQSTFHEYINNYEYEFDNTYTKTLATD